jgi:hypothetical protein
MTRQNKWGELTEYAVVSQQLTLTLCGNPHLSLRASMKKDPSKQDEICLQMCEVFLHSMHLHASATRTKEHALWDH